MEKKMKSNLQSRLAELMAKERSQDDAAKKIGISRQNLAKYMSGKALPNSFNLYKIASYFKVSCDYLLGGEMGQNHDINYIIEKTGLTHKSIKKLSEYAKGKETDAILIAINMLLEYNSADFLKAFARYTLLSNIENDMFTDQYYVNLYYKYKTIQAAPTNYESDDRVFETLKLDDIIYHQLFRDFNSLLDVIKNDESKIRETIKDFEIKYKNEHDYAVSEWKDPREMELFEINF